MNNRVCYTGDSTEGANLKSVYECEMERKFYVSDYFYYKGVRITEVRLTK